MENKYNYFANPSFQLLLHKKPFGALISLLIKLHVEQKLREIFEISYQKAFAKYEAYKIHSECDYVPSFLLFHLIIICAAFFLLQLYN